MAKRAILRKINFSCETCGAAFISKKSCKSRLPKYCSRSCSNKSKEKDKRCFTCGVHVSWVNKKFCSKECCLVERRGKKMTEESKKKMSIVKLGKPIPHLHNVQVREKIKQSLTGRPNPNMRGEKHPNYKDGGAKTSERLFEMGRIEYKNWRKAVYERDKYTCRICGSQGGRLNADHIKPWSLYPDLRYDIENGRTLCVACHRKTDTFGGPRKSMRTTQDQF